MSADPVNLADEEAVRRVLTETLAGLWTAVNNLSRLRPSRNPRYRVTIFGSARTDPGHWVYREAKRLSAALSALGCDIITGGGPGLMQAANEGARLEALEATMKRHFDQAIGSRETHFLVFASVAAFLVGCSFIAWGMLGR